jgi:hypothetical protein
VVVDSSSIVIKLVVVSRERVIPSKKERAQYDNKNSPIKLAAVLTTSTLLEALNFFRNKTLGCSSGCNCIVGNNSLPFDLVFLTGSDSFILIVFHSD